MRKKYLVGQIVPAGEIVDFCDQPGRYMIRCLSCGFIRKEQATLNRCKECYEKNRRKYSSGSVVNGVKIYERSFTKTGHDIFLIKCTQCDEKVWKYRGGMKSICKDCKAKNSRISQLDKLVNKKISSYEYSSKKRNLKMSLDKSHMKELFLSNCHYCGRKPSPLNGIDRIDSDKGYEVDNVRPCCSICNYAKRDRKNKEWESWIMDIVKYNTVRYNLG